MSSTDSQDHAVFWADNADMREKTIAYHERVKKALQSGILRDGVRHPWMEHDVPVDWNIRIFELEGDHCDLPDGPPQFANPRDLLMYWEDTPKDGTAGKTNRRVIVLEDMNPRLVELLGVLLDIPPEFFLAHCEEAVDLSVVGPSGGKQGSSTYWKVPVPQRRSLPDGFEGPYGQCYVESGNFDRGGVALTEDVEYFSFRSLVSYWGKTYGPDSWTAVLLVDPQTTHIRIEPRTDSTESATRICLENWRAARNVLHEVVIGSTNTEIPQPYARSMFDAVVEANTSLGMMATDDPFSATIFARNFIRAAWEEWIYRDEWGVHDTLFDDERQHQGYRGTNTLQDLEALTDQDNKTVQAYQKLMEERQTIQGNSRALRAIIWKFRCRDTEYVSQQEKELQDAMREESKLWTFLDEKLQVMERIIGDHMEMYSQRAAMEESFAAKLQTRESNKQTEEANRQTAAANRMARSSGQLTKIATIIVPCTFVASIFSMNGKFAAGESLFFVYWAVSVPATLALLVWVMFGTNISETIEGRRKRMASRTDKLGDRTTLMTDKISKIGWRRYFFNFGRGRPARDEEKGE